MKRTCLQWILLFALVVAGRTGAARSVTDFNGGWRFALGEHDGAAAVEVRVPKRTRIPDEPYFLQFPVMENPPSRLYDNSKSAILHCRLKRHKW